MNENQHNKNLQQLRSKIDLIDNQIIELLKQRMAIIPEVSKIKKENNEKFFIKSSREADMIKNLINKVDENSLKFVIAKIWRKIITLANNHEQKLRIGIHNPLSQVEFEYLVKDYYCEQVSITNFDSSTNLILAMQNLSINIGIFQIPPEYQESEKKDSFQENWWINLANNKLGLKIYTKIPFIELKSSKNANIDLVACAIKESEQSMQDFTLICLEIDEKIQKNQIISWLNNNQIKARIIKNTKLKQINSILFYLIELQGFLLEENLKKLEPLNGISSPYLKVLGHYPAPIIIDDI